MAHPVEELMSDHRLIESVLDALESRLRVQGTPDIPAQFFEQVLDFLTNFADGCHHFKEEDALFPALQAKGMPVDGGPIGVMLHEHEMERARLTAMRESVAAFKAGRADALDDLKRQALDYIQLLRHHVWKEDHILFRIATQALTPGEAAIVLERFHDDSDPRTAPETSRRYRELAHSLCTAVMTA
jgi:hemerythrin-like domain-containing protein